MSWLQTANPNGKRGPTMKTHFVVRPHSAPMGTHHEKASRGAAPLDFDADFSHELEGGGALADAAF
jgi:hypothetical protein